MYSIVIRQIPLVIYGGSFTLNISSVVDFYKSRVKKGISPTRLIVISFFVVIVAGTLLLMLPISTKDGSIDLLDAFFTATSATCVTGLVVFDTFTKFTRFGQVIILMLIQIGGLGLITLASFLNIAVGKRLGFKGMRIACESVGSMDISRVGQFLTFVVKVALIAEAIGAILLGFVFVPQFGPDGMFMSVFVAISSFCNAGFDVFGFMGQYSSLMPFASNPFVLFIVGSLITCGGLGFIVWYDILAARKTKHLQMHTKIVLVMTAALIVIGTVFFAMLEWNRPSTLGPMNVFDKISNSLFQSVTCRTAGFNSVDLGGIGNVTKLMMIMLMFIGAAPGGTGGGIKITTLSVIIVAVMSVIAGKNDATIRNRRIDQKTVYKSMAIFILSALAVLISAMIVFFNTGPEINEINSVFETTSAFATVGLSVGVTAMMNPIAKIVTMITMFLGRVGPISLAITLSAKSEDAAHKRAVLPETKIIVG